MHIYLVHNRHRYKLDELQDTYSKANKLVRFCLFFALLLRTCKLRCACDWVCLCLCMCDWVSVYVCVSVRWGQTQSRSLTLETRWMSSTLCCLKASLTKINPKRRREKKVKKTNISARFAFIFCLAFSHILTVLYCSCCYCFSLRLSFGNSQRFRWTSLSFEML